MPHKLYGQQISLFTGKARAYLRWKGIDFEEVPASMEVYKDVIVPRVGFPVVPVVVTDQNETVQDTTIIIDYFEGRTKGPSIYPSTPKQRLVSLLLEIYGDEWLVIPAMHYRWHYNKAWAMEQFGKDSIPNASHEEQMALGEKLSTRFRGFCGPLGITETTQKAIEASYITLLHDLDRHFAVHPYLLGSRPSIGDFGMIGPLYAHLYRDPASQKVMEEHGPNVARWVERMQEPPAPLCGDFLPNDEIPETLLPVLARMMSEQLPVLANTVKELATWLDQNPNTDIPRAIGMHSFTIEGVTGQRMIMTYTQWMLQRATSFFEGLNDNDRQSVDKLLEAVGGTGFADIQITRPVELRKFRLAIS